MHAGPTYSGARADLPAGPSWPYDRQRERDARRLDRREWGSTTAGRGQAQALGKRLGGLPVKVIVSSPLQRCQETSVILADALGALTVETVEDLGECRYGAWTGGALKDLARDPLWRVVQDQPSAARFPDSEEFPGESIAEMQLRAVRAIRATDAAVARDHGPDALWVAVSHGDVIKSVIADAAGAHLDAVPADPRRPGLAVGGPLHRAPALRGPGQRRRRRPRGAGAPPPKPAEEGEGDEGTGSGHEGSDGADAVGAGQVVDTTGDAPVGGGAGAAD